MTGTRALAAALLAVALAACGGSRRHTLTIPYTTQQPMCMRAQLGEHATVTGDGPRSFGVVCRQNGPADGSSTVYTWDAQQAAPSALGTPGT